MKNIVSVGLAENFRPPAGMWAEATRNRAGRQCVSPAVASTHISSDALIIENLKRADGHVWHCFHTIIWRADRELYCRNKKSTGDMPDRPVDTGARQDINPKVVGSSALQSTQGLRQSVTQTG
jgi:hypothetical protein